MFQIGDLVVYGTTGVCVVKDITTLDMDGISKEKLYYILQPYYRRTDKVCTPVDNPKSVLRPIITLEEVHQLIREIPGIEELFIEQERMREECYKNALRTGDCRAMVSIIKTLYARKLQRAQEGRKTTATDERYLRMAEDCLFSELALPLGIPREEVKDYLINALQEL